MKGRKTKSICSVLALVVLMVASPLAFAGSLEPPGPPSPTMKTLDEVEPRIPIHASDIPLTIIEPNSYYLTEDINVPTTPITVAANDVTIDLMGYTITGPDTGTNYGIYLFGHDNMEIRNGTVRDFYIGIKGGNDSENLRVIDVRSISNKQWGIALIGTGNLIKDCTASDNGHSSTGGNVHGIYAGRGSTVTGCIVSNNGYQATADVHGISVEYGCTVTGNTVFGNGELANADVYGIHATGSTVIGNTVVENGTSAIGDANGIYLVGSCLVDQNTSIGNGSGAASATNMNSCGTCTLGTNHTP